MDLRERSWVPIVIATLLLTLVIGSLFFFGHRAEQQTEIPDRIMEAFHEFSYDIENLTPEEFLQKYFPEGFGNSTNVITITLEPTPIDLY